MKILKLSEQGGAEQPQYQMEYDSIIQDLTKHKMNCQNLMGSTSDQELKKKYSKISREISQLLITLAEL